MLQRLVDLIAPPACAACGVPPPRHGEPLCVPCRAALPWLPGPRCARCALPVPCGPPCPAGAAAFSASWAPLAHAGPAGELVARVKFDGAVAVCRLLASLVAAQVPEALLRDATLVPVAGDPVRRRTRGVDHAAALAASLAVRTGVPAVAVLERRMPRRRRAQQSRAARRAADPGLRVAAAPPPVALLVDDVHTTGATLHAAALALRAAGSVDVRAVTVTRALHMHHHRR